jgi:hypothetical protein
VLNRLAVSSLFSGLAVCAVLSVAACSGGNPNDANAQETDDTIGTARRLVIVPAPSGPYRVVASTDTGSVSGEVLFGGVPPGDTILQIEAEQNGCNKALTVKRLERNTDGKVTNAIVWLTTIRQGRALPLNRRFELRNGDCTWEPMVQVVATGGAINLFNEDPLVEQANIIDIATGDTAGVAPFTDGGQVIPYGRVLTAPKALEFSIESRPMSRAWVIALDHPYSDVTKETGTFTISGIPAGQYTLRAWHPMLGVVDTVVTVSTGQVTRLNAQFK